MVIQWHLMGFDGIYDDMPSGIQKTNWKDPPCYHFKFANCNSHCQRVSIDISPIDSL